MSDMRKEDAQGDFIKNLSRLSLSNLRGSFGYTIDDDYNEDDDEHRNLWSLTFNKNQNPPP